VPRTSQNIACTAERAETGHDACQQNRIHPVQARIALPVSMVGVRVEVQEVAGRPWMAFPARFRPVHECDGRGRIGDRRDVVTAVAVGAGGGRAVSPRGQHVMHAHGVLVQLFAVTIATVMGHRRLIPGEAGVGRNVGLVAVGAVECAFDLPARRVGPRGFQLLQMPAMHAGFHPVRDETMALRAGGIDVGGMQRRPRIFPGQDAVTSMAIGADGRHKQSRSQQPATVPAVQIRLRLLLVAPAAAFQLVVPRNRRPAVGDRQHAVHVVPVTLVATQHRAGALMVSRTRLVMDVGQQGVALLPVARAAGFRQLRWVSQRLRITDGARPVHAVTGDARGRLCRLCGLCSLCRLCLCRLLQVPAMHAVQETLHHVGTGLRVGLLHGFGVGMAMAAEGGDVRRRFDHPETVLDRMGFAQIQRVRVAAVAVLAAESFLPVNIVGQIGGRDEQVLHVGIPDIRVAVAGRAEIFLQQRVVLSGGRRDQPHQAQQWQTTESSLHGCASPPVWQHRRQRPATVRHGVLRLPAPSPAAAQRSAPARPARPCPADRPLVRRERPHRARSSRSSRFVSGSVISGSTVSGSAVSGSAVSVRPSPSSPDRLRFDRLRRRRIRQDDLRFGQIQLARQFGQLIDQSPCQGAGVVDVVNPVADAKEFHVVFDVVQLRGGLPRRIFR
jgi:hypothetical protein